ncbi:MAG TPA: hypothetical protein VFU85_05280 [Nocardioides sp.]|nr:hypothetical protein [Nocardioides sp.]
MSMEYFLAKAMIEDRMRDLNQQELARDVRHGKRPDPAATPARKARRHSRLWSLVHVRQTAS